MNNYPPGVMGNEPQIVGYPDLNIDACCIFCLSTLIEVGDSLPDIETDAGTVYLAWYHCYSCEQDFVIGIL